MIYWCFGKGVIMEKDINNNNYVKNQNPYNKYRDYIQNDVLKLYYQFVLLL